MCRSFSFFTLFYAGRASQAEDEICLPLAGRFCYLSLGLPSRTPAIPSSFLLIRHRVTPIRAYDWSSSLLRFTVRLHQRLQQSRCLRCSDCYRVERTSFRAGIPQLWTSAFSRRTRLPRLTLLKFSCDQLLPRLMGRRRARRTRRHSAGTSTLI
jgi:hypothetical protein